MAIIVVLAAIAVPTFGKQLETARESNDAEAIRAAATDAFSTVYTKYVTEGAGTNDANLTTVINGVELKQVTAGFDYVTPTITIGSGTETLNSSHGSKANTVAGTHDVTFVFEEESGGQGGIKLSSITIAATPTNPNP